MRKAREGGSMKSMSSLPLFADTVLMIYFERRLADEEHPCRAKCEVMHGAIYGFKSEVCCHSLCIEVF